MPGSTSSPAMPRSSAKALAARLRHAARRAGLLKALRGVDAAPQHDLPLIEASDNPLHFERHVFICGLHRSGTTLLENHLRFRVAALEAPVPENEGQHLQDVFPAANRHGGPGRFAFAPEMRMLAPTPEEAERAHRRLLACWTT